MQNFVVLLLLKTYNNQLNYTILFLKLVVIEAVNIRLKYKLLTFCCFSLKNST